jgi:hypothetical protein
MPFGPAQRFEVVGVVGDVRHRGLDARPSPEIYLPFAQNPFPAMPLVARVDDESTPLAEMLRVAVAALDDHQPVPGVVSMAELIAAGQRGRSLHTRLIAVFAAVATLLAVVGIYGTAASRIAGRRRDFAVRRALGATSRDILGAALAPSLGPIAAGTGLGLLAALASSRLLARFLYGVGALDPLVLLAAPVLLAGVAVLGSALPARRALRIDPAVELRCE